MEQWRNPASHLITPKLIYTTASKPEYGYKAFVVEDSWYVKLHGGVSQQYHYTGLYDPSKPMNMTESFNNLTGCGTELCLIFQRNNLPEVYLLHYVAAIYNSQLALDFLDEASSSSDLCIRLPYVRREQDLCFELARIGEQLRDLHRLVHYLPETNTILAANLESLVSQRLIEMLALERREEKTPRFKATMSYTLPPDFLTEVNRVAGQLQQDVDEMVYELYSD